MRKVFCFLVESQKPHLFKPIACTEVKCSNQVQNGYTKRVNNANVQNSVHICEFEANLYMWTCIKINDIFLPQLFSIEFSSSLVNPRFTASIIPSLAAKFYS